jgi:hypothetical protein
MSVYSIPEKLIEKGLVVGSVKTVKAMQSKNLHEGKKNSGQCQCYSQVRMFVVEFPKGK